MRIRVISRILNETTAADYTLNGNRLVPTLRNAPELALDLNSYIPLGWSLGGWRYGVIPQVRYRFTNNRMDSGGMHDMQDLSLGARAYVMRPVARSGIYPRWGVSAELRYRCYPGLTALYRGNAYAAAYAYTPGLQETHGFRWSGIVEFGTGPGHLVRPFAAVAPRGLQGAALRTLIASYPVRSKFTVDYVLPFGSLDASWLCPVAYLRNFELDLHYDICAMFSKSRSGNLTSAGADLTLRLGNLLWIPYDTRIGVTYCYNGGSMFASINPAEAPVTRHYVGMLFSISL